MSNPAIPDFGSEPDTCPKCGETPIAWWKQYEKRTDRLLVRCRCGYSFYTQSADATPTPTGNVTWRRGTTLADALNASSATPPDRVVLPKLTQASLDRALSELSKPFCGICGHRVELHELRSTSNDAQCFANDCRCDRYAEDITP